MSNPISAFVFVAISSLILLYTYWDKVISFIKEKYDWVVDKIAVVKDFLGVGSDKDINMKKDIDVQQDNTIKKESINNVKVDNKATIDGNITVNSLNKNFRADMKKLDMGYQ